MILDDPDEMDNYEVSRMLVSRRQAIRAAGFGVGAAFIGLGTSACGEGASVSALLPAAATSAAACMKLTAEQIEGPYYLDYELVRSDIREKKHGVPLTLTLTAVDSVTCKPLRNAAIEIWHCDAVGVYSGYAASTSTTPTTPPSSAKPTTTSSATPSTTSTATPSMTSTATPSMTSTASPTGSPPAGFTPPPGGGGGAAHQEPINKLTFLRGMQPTDARGRATFTTIVPGWYTGRAVHMHVKVHVDGKLTKSGYVGGHQAHTGQLYFPERAILQVAKLPQYKKNKVARTLLKDDILYPGGGATGGLLTLRYARGKGKIKFGIKASTVMAVETTKVHDGSDAPAINPGGPPSSSATPSTTASATPSATTSATSSPTR